MAADIIAFSLGKNELSRDFNYLPDEHLNARDALLFNQNGNRQEATTTQDAEEPSATPASVLRVATIVTPGRDLSYPISLASFFGSDTITADFSNMATGDKMKSAAKWIDLIDSESIWR